MFSDSVFSSFKVRFMMFISKSSNPHCLVVGNALFLGIKLPLSLRNSFQNSCKSSLGAKTQNPKPAVPVPVEYKERTQVPRESVIPTVK